MKHLDARWTSDGGRGRAMGVGRIRTAAVLVGCLSLLVACDYTSTAKAQDLCSQYDQLAASVNKVLDEDPLSTKAAELRARSEEVSRQLDEFQAVSDGRFDNVLSAVRAEVAAVREAAVEAGSEAFDTARPQIKDSLENLSEAWAWVQDRADVQCGGGS